MALSDFYERLAGITGQGQRETDFRSMRNQREATKRDMMAQIALQKQRNVQFNAIAPNVMGTSNNEGQPAYNGDFLFPLHGKLNVSSPYGVHRKGHKSAHTGIDWSAPSGTPIYAPGSGTIKFAGQNKIYGNQTILDIGGGKSFMFGHQSGFAVKPGQHINAGQLIGYVGSTGWSTGPHLHFESWLNGKPINPLSWFQ